MSATIQDRNTRLRNASKRLHKALWEANDGDKAARARLRRIGETTDRTGRPVVDLAQAASVEPFRRFITRLDLYPDHAGDLPEWKEERLQLAAVAAVALAYLKEDVNARSAAILMGGEAPAVSEARFERLMRCETPTELLPQILRTLSLLKHKAPAGELGAAILDWDARVKRRWAFDYWRKPGGDAREDNASAAATPDS